MVKYTRVFLKAYNYCNMKPTIHLSELFSSFKAYLELECSEFVIGCNPKPTFELRGSL